MAQSALVDDEYLFRMMIQGTELQDSLASQRQARPSPEHSLKEEILDSIVAQCPMWPKRQTFSLESLFRSENPLPAHSFICGMHLLVPFSDPSEGMGD